MKKIIIALAVLVLVVAGLFTFYIASCEDDWCFIFTWQKVKSVNSFADCENRGFPVMESYPRQCRAGDKTFVEEIAHQSFISDKVTVSSPLINEKISSPIVIKGEARGVWFFEASFPIEITDADGNVLGQGIAQADGEWMTNDFVPFTAPITFTSSPTPTGFIILKKDNPSGLPEHDAQEVMPVRF